MIYYYSIHLLFPRTVELILQLYLRTLSFEYSEFELGLVFQFTDYFILLYLYFSIKSFINIEISIVKFEQQVALVKLQPAIP